MQEAATAASKSTPLCEVRRVYQDFKLPSGQLHRVLEDVSLSVLPNEVVALLGPSGCGKSTILRILAGLITPTQGEVLYHNQPLQGLNPGIAIVFQSFALYPWMTVAENVTAVLKAAGVGGEDARERAEKAINLVGLAGFASVYPRELSGGMKQRVGMARALAVDPEMLFMDEPFSQVDALTAESLRAEVIDIWSMPNKNPSSILMVSHDIKEVAFMADRIVILGANPGVVRKIVVNDMPRPRNYRSPQLLALVDQLHDVITGHELPDVPVVASRPGAQLLEPLPQATSSEIVGLLEYLDARGGQQDVFRIAAETNREFGQLINVAKAAEMLDFVDTPKSIVLLEPTGRAFVQANATDRKRIWREQLLQLPLFHATRDAIEQEPDKTIDADFVQEQIILQLPQENYERTFHTFIGWSRFGELFKYDERTGKLTMAS